MLLGLAIGLCGIVGLIAVGSPRTGLASVFLAYIFLPFTPVGRIYVGDTGVGLHIATLLVLMLAALKLVASPNNATAGRQIPGAVHALIAIFFLGVFGHSLFVGSAPGVSLAFLLNQMVAPYLFFVLCVKENTRDPAVLTQAIRLYVGIGVFQSVVAIGVATGVWPQPFESLYSTISWWREAASAGRQVGTLDTPLNLGLFLASCVPLVLVLRTTSGRVVCQALLVTGILFTQSRIGLAAAAVGIAFISVYGVRRLTARVAIALTVLVGYFALRWFGLLDSVYARVADDRGSSEARSLAWGYSLSHLKDFLFTGVGVFDSKTYLLTNGFTSSPESAIVSYALSYGLVLSSCYFLAMIFLIIYTIRTEHRLSAQVVSALLVLISIQLYSSIATESSAAFILWTTLFFAFGGLASSQPQNYSTDAHVPLNREGAKYKSVSSSVGAAGSVNPHSALGGSRKTNLGA